MSRFKRETILREDSTGAIIAGATVTVYLGGTTDLATIYSTKTAPTPVTGSAVTTDSKGKYVYYVDDTDYANYQLFKETITKTGYTTVTYDDIDIIETVFDHLDVDNNITVGGTVDGRDISADLDQAVKQASSPTFASVLLTNLTDGYVPYRVAATDLLGNSPIFSDGTNVGIGTTEPGRQLELYGAAPIIFFNDSTNGPMGYIGDSAILAEGTPPADSLSLRSEGELRLLTGANSTRVTIDATSGSVGIGTTSPSYQLQLSTDSAGKPSTSTWTIVSDMRLKESIELANLDLCYEAVKNIPLKYYRWRDDVYTVEQVKDRGKLGWIADDVEKVYPKAINIIPFELLTKEKIEDCKSVNNDQVYAAMYGAIQKLIEKIEILESKNTIRRVCGKNTNEKKRGKTIRTYKRGKDDDRGKKKSTKSH